ncbi:MAG: hypothetical protein WDO24_06790 [Pseudomonadota bacterium]
MKLVVPVTEKHADFRAIALAVTVRLPLIVLVSSVVVGAESSRLVFPPLLIIKAPVSTFPAFVNVIAPLAPVAVVVKRRRSGYGKGTALCNRTGRRQCQIAGDA